jgi:hypothetical protein
MNGQMLPAMSQRGIVRAFTVGFASNPATTFGLHTYLRSPDIRFFHPDHRSSIYLLWQSRADREVWPRASLKSASHLWLESIRRVSSKRHHPDSSR